MITGKTKILNEVITITLKPGGIADGYFRRDYAWFQKELNIKSSRVFKGVYTLFELRFSDLSDLMAGLDWLEDYFQAMNRSVLYYEKEIKPNVRWTKRRGY